MMKQFFKYSVVIIAISVVGCKGKKDKAKEVNTSPTVTEQGTKITFPDTAYTTFFATEIIGKGNVNAQFAAPAKIVATVLPSREGAGQNIVLFDNPDLASNYSQLIQHLINIKQKQNIVEQKKSIIKQKQIELTRFKDLANHGAGTGKDVSDAQTDLIMAETELRIAINDIANEKTGIIEHEAKLKLGGFNPELLQKGGTNKAYVICDIPENQMTKIKEGTNCNISFTAFPNETFTGHIDDLADVVDNATRMVKLRISIDNSTGKFKAGMFASVSLGISEGNNITIANTALVTIQGKNYAFVKTAPTVFERKEINIGSQIGDRIIVYTGLNTNDQVATNGVMQLKGLSFGY
jgi:multidrug efflux pump subunit AcrA (membrane-fusion protein)